ncbi:MAG: sigma-70 family RNA polymerase sigma factor [Sphingobacteriales bacterium]|nr:sigma-70 family RNA polymerase sigma factor [Sphingobacteriales bacterium]
MNLNTTYSEQELVASLRQRDEKAFAYLYDHYAAALYGVVNTVVADKETANDVLQNVFVNIWRKFDSYDPAKGRLFTWMMNIARNAAIDEIRSKGYANTRKTQPLPEENEISGAVTGPRIEDSGLKKVLGRLKEEWRVLVDLSYYQGFTHEEIAKALDLPLGTVKTRIRSALIQLRTLLQ